MPTLALASSSPTLTRQAVHAPRAFVPPVVAPMLGNFLDFSPRGNLPPPPPPPRDDAGIPRSFSAARCRDNCCHPWGASTTFPNAGGVVAKQKLSRASAEGWRPPHAGE